MTKGELAEKYFNDGYNCAQAVVLAFCDEMNMNKETALRLASSFGGGMGRLREVCGAVSGMFMVAGVMHGYSDPTDVQSKAEHYALIQKMAKMFKEENGSIVCRELLGVSGESSPTPEKRCEKYYKKRPCGEFVHIAADIAEKILF